MAEKTPPAEQSAAAMTSMIRTDVIRLMNMMILHRADDAQSHSFAQSQSTSAEAFLSKRFPGTTFAAGARACMFSEESPIPLLPDVAKGTTVLPVKS